MALVVRLQVTEGAGMMPIETLEIRRLTGLRSRRHPEEEVHRYTATRWSATGVQRGTAEFRHRYGDGAWKCTLLALQALEAGAR